MNFWYTTAVDCTREWLADICLDGAVSQSGDWLIVEQRPASGIIGVTATYKGRTYQGCAIFRVEPDDTIIALEGGGTLFVESAYTNYPGETTVRTSTQEKLTAYWALREDGTLTLSATEGAAISVRAGSPDGEPVELPCEWYGCSGDVDSMDFYVTNNDPSRAGEPVEFCLEFEGDEDYYDCDWSGTLDVVKYRVEADANWPSNKVRHFFGPLETFKAKIENGPSFDFNAPLTPGEYNMSFDYNGSTCTFPSGARRPLGIDGKNMIKGCDQVQVRLGGCPSEDGGYTLNIPLKWGVDGGPYCYDAGHAPMTVRVQADGKVTVSKFGITRGRAPYGLYEGN